MGRRKGLPQDAILSLKTIRETLTDNQVSLSQFEEISQVKRLNHHQLIEQYDRLCYWSVERHPLSNFIRRNNFIEYEEVVNLLRQDLLMIRNNYRPELGISFMSYASMALRRRIGRHFSESRKDVIPIAAQEIGSSLSLHQSRFQKKFGKKWEKKLYTRYFQNKMSWESFNQYVQLSRIQVTSLNKDQETRDYFDKISFTLNNPEEDYRRVEVEDKVKALREILNYHEYAILIGESCGDSPTTICRFLQLAKQYSTPLRKSAQKKALKGYATAKARGVFDFYFGRRKSNPLNPVLYQIIAFALKNRNFSLESLHLKLKREKLIKMSLLHFKRELRYIDIGPELFSHFCREKKINVFNYSLQAATYIFLPKCPYFEYGLDFSGFDVLSPIEDRKVSPAPAPPGIEYSDSQKIARLNFTQRQYSNLLKRNSSQLVADLLQA